MKKLKYVKLFESFSNNEETEELYQFIDSLKVEDYIKDSLKNSDDLLIIWNTQYFLNQGIKDLMKLFEEGSIRYWNKYIDDLEQDSHIKYFYSDVDDFIFVLDRITKFLKHSDVAFIMTEIFGYCNPVSLRYLSEKCIESILKNKDIIRKFQALWVSKLNMSEFGSEHQSVNKISSFNYRMTGIKPFVPTSDEEHEKRISEIIMDKIDSRRK